LKTCESNCAYYDTHIHLLIKLLHNRDHHAPGFNVRNSSNLKLKIPTPNLPLEIIPLKTWRQYLQCQGKILHQSFLSSKIMKTIICPNLTPQSILHSPHLQFDTRSLLSISQDQQLHLICASLSHSSSSLKREFA
jgi:hypothetical protein